MSVPRTYSLPNGAKIPSLGFGTWTVWQEKVEEPVKLAIEAGFRHIDGAWVYNNEDQIGNAIDAKIKDGSVKRDDLFITAKLWNNAHRRGAVIPQLEASLKKLKLNYVDLYLIHWPMSFKEGDDNFPKDSDGKHIFEFHDLLDTWKGMEDAFDAGLAKNIGISNFNERQVQKILDGARIKPCMNQLEVNPFFSNEPLVKFCKEKGIMVTAFGPFGNPSRPWKDSADPVLFEQPILKEIAASRGKSPAQVCLRFLLQRGLVVLSRSTNPSRIKENLQVYDFELSSDEMEKMFSLNKDFRVYCEGIAVDHPEYPF